MKLNLIWVLLLALMTISCQSNSDEQNNITDQETSQSTMKPDPDNAGLDLAEGMVAKKVAEDLGKARHIVARNNGDVYVALRQMKNGGGTVAMRDTTGDGVMDIKTYFGNLTGTGIDIRNGYLYRSTTTEVYRYQLKEDQLMPESNPETIVTGFPEERQHAAKAFTFDDQGNIYVDVGAPSNACMEQMRTKGSSGQDPCPLLEKYASIWQFKADKTGQQHTNGNKYVKGLRHVVALDWNHRDNELYLAQHGRDQLRQFFPDLYTEKENAELPAEEFHKAEEGDNLGWPYCYYDQRQGKKVLGPEYGGDGEKIGRCDQYQDPLIGFPGHWAPNDLIFYQGNQLPSKYKNGAFIAFHGSWNRAPLEQEGYFVAFVPFDGDQPKEDWIRFADGFTGKESLKSPDNAEYRPMGLASSPDGAIYITDSQQGDVWRVWHQNQ